MSDIFGEFANIMLCPLNNIQEWKKGKKETGIELQLISSHQTNDDGTTIYSSSTQNTETKCEVHQDKQMSEDDINCNLELLCSSLGSCSLNLHCNV